MFKLEDKLNLKIEEIKELEKKISVKKNNKQTI